MVQVLPDVISKYKTRKSGTDWSHLIRGIPQREEAVDQDTMASALHQTPRRQNLKSVNMKIISYLILSIYFYRFLNINLKLKKK